MTYIQRKDNEFKLLETVDEFEERSEARKILSEYQLSDPYGEYYLSTRACKEWREVKNDRSI